MLPPTAGDQIKFGGWDERRKDFAHVWLADLSGRASRTMARTAAKTIALMASNGGVWVEITGELRGARGGCVVASAEGEEERSFGRIVDDKARRPRRAWERYGRVCRRR
uniref:Uncharacterized protein n=1 Tax=Cucumis melo TaxID=3656 RepID=A0A9I9D5M1_CUCME